MNSAGFQAVDGWVLAAVALTGGANGASLCAVVGSADAINHEVLEPEEFASSLNRLGAAGLLRRVADGVALGGAAAVHWERFAGKRIYLLKAVERFRALLTCEPHVPPVAFESINVSLTEAAIAQYIAMAQTALAATRKAGT